MKRKSPATEQAAKKRNLLFVDSGDAVSATKQPHLERLFEEASANATASQKNLLEQVKTLGYYPKGTRIPRTKPKPRPTASR
jgi:hypothetical protein